MKITLTLITILFCANFHMLYAQKLEKGFKSKNTPKHLTFFPTQGSKIPSCLQHISRCQKYILILNRHFSKRTKPYCA